MATGRPPVVQKDGPTSDPEGESSPPPRSPVCSSCGKPLETGWMIAQGGMGGIDIEWVPASADPLKFLPMGREKLAGGGPLGRTTPLKASRCPTCRRVTFRY